MTANQLIEQAIDAGLLDLAAAAIDAMDARDAGTYDCEDESDGGSRCKEDEGLAVNETLRAREFCPCCGATTNVDEIVIA